MEFEELARILYEALQLVLIKDEYLLRNDIYERTIAHRLAVYLENKCEGYFVDCEYNGNINPDNNRKFLNLLWNTAIRLGFIKPNTNMREYFSRYVYPDIIIHKRGENGSENNLLIIEIKKSSNADSGEWDAEKLARFTSSENENNYNYRYGAFVFFVVEGEPSYSVDWYQNGVRFVESEG